MPDLSVVSLKKTGVSEKWHRFFFEIRFCSSFIEN